MYPNEATFTKMLISTTFPYVKFSIPIEITRLLDLKAGDYVEVRLKVIKRREPHANVSR